MNRHHVSLAFAVVAVSMAAAPAPPFRDMAADVGLTFQHVTGATGDHFMPEIMGAGAALLDYDNDGDLDVYVIQGTALDPGKQPLFPPPVGFKPGNRLFRNLLSPTGTLHFVDVTESAGVGHIGYGMGAATGDYDNDGFLDLYVTNVGRNVLYHNNGDGTFADVTGKAGVDDARWSTSAAFLDYDSDGFLDLFVGNYVDFTVQGNKHCHAPTGEPDYCTPMAYTPVPSRLFHNTGTGTFVDVTESSGIGSSYGPALGVLCADFNGDGRTDIFVANDTAANRLWLNQGAGTFREAALQSGVAYNADGRAKAGMGVTAEEVDDDGTLTLLVTNLTREGATLFRGNRKDLFEDVTSRNGLATPTFGFTGFGTSWFDYDNDGRLDLFIANGAVTIVESLRAQPYPYGQSNLLFHNEGPQRFSDVSNDAGPAFRRIDVGRGVAIGDIDNDGAVDVLVTNNNGAVRLLHNDVGARQHWLEVSLVGTKSNLSGIGARVALLRDGAAPRWRRVHTDSSYLSASDVRVHFGLGERSDVRGLVVQWPDGSSETWDNVKPDRVVVLRQGTGRSR
ncbi:FG-GAP repeat [Luteitalea pratensis]|uniref:FG-GAP repeat n=1 Tax=Luteitalea pratensis TaxID=1855912 RepID=A0A143PJR5_LUTPR|nr:CRTAC1 family protein [Luteitalea pratensis]AMY08490.1 FG-GAP repeat [Luteitalea pratensis]